MRIIVIPDVQAKAGEPTEHLEALGNYIVDKKPDTIVCLGDWFDLPSISTHSPKGHIDYEGKRYMNDIVAGWEAMDTFLDPLKRLSNRQKKNRKAAYTPKMVFCMGNHEYRRDRLIDQEPWLIGALQDFELQRFGWEISDFLIPVKINGVNFCHYAQGGAMGRPISRAHLIATKKHESWVVGHQQVLDIYVSPYVKTDGSRVQCVIAGAFYQHDENYMKHQGNQHWRGALMLNEVHNGSFDICTLSINYLLEKWI